MITMKLRIRISLAALFICSGILWSCAKQQRDGQNAYVTVHNTGFLLKGQSYTFVGANFWYGAYLGSPGAEGDRERLLKELDLLQASGITNLRILGASEQASHTRVLHPSFQSAPGEINENLLIGLDFLLSEMEKRDMKAIVFMNNFWEWSGGMSVYNEWFGHRTAVDPGESGDWHGFMNHAGEFYNNMDAREAWYQYLEKVINRTNTFTGRLYKEDPVIMSWQLANEPRPGSGSEGMENADAFIEWIHKSAAFIKSLAPNQLVSTGNEGLMGSLGSEHIYLTAHNTPHVDFLTFHMWPKNWGWFDANNMESSFEQVKENSLAYMSQHIEYAVKLNKPIILSEFGLGRDYENLKVGSSVTYRDRFLEFVFNEVEKEIKAGSPLSGTNLWSWGGFGICNHADFRWRPGDPFTGDPPQEPQGLNSVFSSDTTTIAIIRKHYLNINSNTKPLNN
jgi:mannan endo-1,4-beta-mannosidase